MLQSDEIAQLRAEFQAEISRQTADLHAQIAQQQTEIARLQAAQANSPSASNPDQSTEHRSSRRRMLKKLALTAAGVAAATTALAANSQSAAAGYTDNGQPNIGLIGLPGGTAPTGTVVSGIGLLGSSLITDFSKLDRIGGNDTPGYSNIGVFGQAKAGPIGYGVLGAVRPSTPTIPPSRYTRAFGIAGIVDDYDGGYEIASTITVAGVFGKGPTGVVGIGPDYGVSGEGGTFGVYGDSYAGFGVFGRSLGGGTGVTGNGYYGVRSEGILLIVPKTQAGAPVSGDHVNGELYVDKNGVLYYCVAAGTPGTWRTLAGPNVTTGLHILPTPERIIDTRGTGFVGSGDPTGPVPGFAPANTPPAASVRTYTITGRAGQGGTSIPAGATAIVGNVTVVPPGEANGGYLLAYPAGASVPKTSTLNYNTAQVVANSFISGLSSTGKISLAAYKTTDVLIDVVGYYL